LVAVSKGGKKRTCQSVFAKELSTLPCPPFIVPSYLDVYVDNKFAQCEGGGDHRHGEQRACDGAKYKFIFDFLLPNILLEF